MLFSLIVGILCLAMGIWGWYEKSTVKFFGWTTWKFNLFLAVLNLSIAATYIFYPVPQ